MPTCAVVGVHPSVLSIVASIQVSEAVRLILEEKPCLANKLLYCDIGNMEFRKVEIAKAANCPACSSKPSERLTLVKPKLINEVCGREGKRVFIITPRRVLKLNMDDLYSFLINEGFSVKVRTELGITFDEGLKTVSILKSGVMILEGAKDEKEVKNFFTKIIVDELKVSRSNIE
jgi:adenylyltransferase/sulfurtransferase